MLRNLLKRRSTKNGKSLVRTVERRLIHRQRTSSRQTPLGRLHKGGQIMSDYDLTPSERSQSGQRHRLSAALEAPLT